MPELLERFDYKNQPFHSNDFRANPRHFAIAAYVARGNAVYYAEGGSFRLSPGDLVFIPIDGTYFSYWDDQPSEVFSFHFNMKNDLDRRFLLQKISGHAELFDAFREAVDEATSDFRACELFYRIIGEFWGELRTVDTKIDPRIRPAIDFLELTPERECNVGYLASICHMSEPHFFYCFRKSMGRAPMEYRAELLIMNAQRLLVSSELSISEVAERLGFGSETYFRRVFKAKVGVSPREFRRNPMR